MKKFLVLYLSSTPASEQMAHTSPEQGKAMMDMWMAWAKKAAHAIVDLGAPLGNARAVGKGSASKTDSNIAGGSILQGETIDKVTELLLDHPHHHVPGGSIQVLEYLPLPGM